MPDPFVFAGSTPALGLPLLFAGQAQKEFFVNEALCLLDALHGRVVIASQPAPPAGAADGACYRVTSPAVGAWTGKEDKLAVRVAGAWHFVAPAEGMIVFDRGVAGLVTFRSRWEPAKVVAVPSGGTVIDVEARSALAALIAALKTVGALATPTP